jgi:hypothetical protein
MPFSWFLPEEPEPQRPTNSLFQDLLKARDLPSEADSDSLQMRTRAAQNVQSGGLFFDILNDADNVDVGDPELPNGALGVLFRVLNELDRPRAALFAGIKDLQDNDDLSQAVATTWDEFRTGFGSGHVKRNVGFGDLLFNEDREDRNRAQQFVGLIGDIILDPINFIPLAKGIKVSSRFLGSAASKGISTGRNLAPEVIQKNMDRAVDIWKESFIKPQATTAAGKRAEVTLDSIDAYTELHRRAALKAQKERIRIVESITKETGIPADEVSELVLKHMQFTKLADRDFGVPRALNDTMARVYNRYGIDGFDEFMKRSGSRRLRDERPLRRAILEHKFDAAEGAVAQQYGRDATERVKDLIFEMKEGALEREIFEIKNRVRFDPDSPRGRLFASLRKDHLMIAATDEFKTVVANLPGATGQRFGFKMNPLHASDLDSQLQKIGVDEANRLTRTPRPGHPGESMFKLRNGDTGEVVHLPLMEKAFHTDPIYLDTLRSYYANVGVEQSQMLADIVRGYGKVLPKGMFKEPSRVIKESKAVEAAAVVRGVDELGFEQVSRTLTKEGADFLEQEGLKILRGIAGFENVALPAEAADLIMKTNSVYNSAEAVGGIMKVWDKAINQVWKPWTLFVYPEFHSRNIVSNMFLMNIGGVEVADMPKTIAQGVRVLTAGSSDATKARLTPMFEKMGAKGGFSGKLKSVLDEPGLKSGDLPLAEQARKIREFVEKNPNAIEGVVESEPLAFLRLAVDMGIVRGGEFGTAEIARGIEAGLQGQRAGLGTKIRGFVPFASTADNSKALQVGMGIGGAIEDSMRLGMFIDALTVKKMPLMEARKHVLKHMIDYGNLTDFEKNIMKGTLMPFYAWSRHSIPLMAQNLIDEPYKWRVMNKVKREIETQMFAEGEVAEERLVPEYISRGTAVPARRTAKGDYQYFLFNDWIPQAQLSELDSWDEVKQLPLVAGLSPPIQAAAEIMFQKSLFLDAEFGEAKTEFAGMRVSPETATLLRTLRPLSILDRFTRENKPALWDNFIRFMTGFNKVRLSQQTLNRAFAARTQDQNRELHGILKEIAEAQAKGSITPEEASAERKTAIDNFQTFLRTGRQ